MYPVDKAISELEFSAIPGCLFLAQKIQDLAWKPYLQNISMGTSESPMPSYYIDILSIWLTLHGKLGLELDKWIGTHSQLQKDLWIIETEKADINSLSTFHQNV